MGIPDKLKEWLQTKPIERIGVNDWRIFILFKDGAMLEIKSELINYDEAILTIEFSDMQQDELEWSE